MRPGWRRLVPFGLAVREKPRHFREVLRAAWENRGRFHYAWRILHHGVCDGCSLGPRGLADDVVDGLHLCMTRLRLLALNTMDPIPVGRLADVEALRRLDNEALHRLGRLAWPMVREAGERGFRRVSWAEAVRTVARAMAAADPDRMGMFVSSRGLTNEAYYALQKLARVAGTPHVDSCARLCHAASGVALQATLGWGAATCSLKDWIGTDLLLLIGSDLANNQPVSTKYLYHARRAGTRVVVVNPYREPALERYWIPSVAGSALFGTRLMDDYFPVRPGGDIGFLSGVLKALDEAGGWDEEFLQRRTTGADALRAHLGALAWTELEGESGLPESEMRRLARLYQGARTAVVVWSMGLTQYAFGVDNVKMACNLALARGMVGRPRCGVMPIRGHSGVQGTAECGADADKLPGGVPITEASSRRLGEAWGHPVPARRGLRACELLDRAGEGGLDLLYLAGGNHLETMPDREAARRSLERVGVRVHQDIALNTSTLLDAREAVILLPARTRYEQVGGGTSTSTERRVRYTPEVPGPRPGEALSEWEIPARVGRALRPGRPDLFPWTDAGEVRREMALVMPLYAGIERLEREGDSFQWGGERLGADGFPNLPGGRAVFAVCALPRVEVPEGRYLLTTRRGRQFNSLAWGRRDPITGGLDRLDLLVHPEDLAAEGLRDGDRVRLRSDHGSLEVRVRPGPVRRRHVQAFWPEANALIRRRYDPASGEPDYSAAVWLERCDAPAATTPRTP
ncbi:MAG: molybdopterin-dependent oxidoreductase [Planctomycetes bacterium]|nr:molybdopterin-dependent oxidoreductase [Planctomycetota bacterium]